MSEVFCDARKKVGWGSKRTHPLLLFPTQGHTVLGLSFPVCKGSLAIPALHTACWRLTGRTFVPQGSTDTALGLCSVVQGTAMGPHSGLEQPPEVGIQPQDGGQETCPVPAELSPRPASCCGPCTQFLSRRPQRSAFPLAVGKTPGWGEAAAHLRSLRPQHGFWGEPLDRQSERVWKEHWRLRPGKQSPLGGSGPWRNKAEWVLCNQRQDVLERGRTIVVRKPKRN